MNDVRWDKMMQLGRLVYTGGHLTPHSASGREGREREEEQLAQLIGLQIEIDKGGD
uniref:Expressed protein n=1 Tax=Echinococcus granulosus TaxID=6210 RepID=A0A068WIR3_ECHGR|nr:expressed protein [Echinococcus granulosus]